jgi:acetyltransferase-like isoleucine patch superfamily enzyme
MKKLLGLFIAPLPWFLKRMLLQALWGYRLHPTARIGLALVFPVELVMEAGSSIGHLTVCKGLKRLHLGEHSSIGRGNWITGFPLGPHRHFAHQPDRVPELVLGAHSAITNRHLIDCTNSVRIGAFTTFAGFASQILTHSIDLAESRQSSAPVLIGDHCFIGTNCVLLGGSRLPDRSVLGAKSLLNKAHDQPLTLYAGVPAKPVKPLSPDLKYFHRPEGFVH